MKLRLATALIVFQILCLSKESYGQDVIYVNGYYRLQPLSHILNDLISKYELDIQFDVQELSKHRTSYLFSNTHIDRALEIILRDTPMTFYKERGAYVIVGEKDEALVHHFSANTPYAGEPKRYDFTISGKIKDYETGEALPFATIKIKGTTKGSTSNADGFFTLFHVPSDTSILEISYIGYATQNFYLNPTLSLSSIEVPLIPATSALAEIIISGQRDQLMSTSEGISNIKLSPNQISTLPSLGEKDIFRSFQLMPGISGSNEGSSGLYVRGGTPDQNLILYDGFTVYHVDHLFGMFSAFNSNAVKDVQLYKGGFEAKYGGRLSSVMDIVGKTGNENHFNIGGDLSMLSLNIFTEIPVNNKLTILAAARRSYSSALYNKFFDAFGSSNDEPAAAPQGAPGGGRGGRFARQQETAEPTSYFYDLNSKISYRPSSKDLITFSFFNGQDDLDNSRETNRSFGNSTTTGGTTDLTQWGNWGTSSKWSRKWNETFYSNLLFSYSNYYSVRDRLTNRTIVREDTTITINRGSVEDNDLNDYSVKLDNEWELSERIRLAFGIHGTHYDISYRYTQNDTLDIITKNDVADLVSGYGQGTWQVTDRLSLTTGLRTSYYNLSEKVYFEPRASFQYVLTPEIKLKGATGNYYQFANRVIREDVQSGSRDFWVLSDEETVPVGQAQHYILGGVYENDDFLLDIEVYRKNLSGLSEYTLRFAPQFRQPSYDEFFYEGTGFTNGFDLLLQKKFGKYTGWAGYTLSETVYDFPEISSTPYPANHDVTHEFKVVNSYSINGWTFSGTWIYATGKPFTEPVGGYELALLDGTTSEFIALGAKNSSRYPNYHRMDVAITKAFNIGPTGSGSLSLSIFNLYSRNNTWYKEYELEEGEIIETDVNLLGITPNLTFSYKLR